jgi:hypothetical protein
MKRVALLLTFLLTLSFGTVYGGPACVCDLDNAAGLYNVDTIGLGSSVTFNMRLTNDDAVNKVKGATNGFRVYSDDGATWTISDYGPADVAPYGIIFDWVYTINEFSVNGSGADTLGFGGSVMMGAGIPPSYDDVVYYITVDVAADPSLDGKHICLDSSYYPPSGTWAWAYGSAVGTFPPVWNGPYCYVLYDIPNLPPYYVTNPSNYTGDHCVTAVVDFEAADPETDVITWTLDAGPGFLVGSNTTAQWSYAPVLADVGGAGPVDISIDDGLHAPGVAHSMSLTFTNEAPVFTDGCGETVSVGMGNSACITLDGDQVDCDPYTMAVTGVTPTPNGPVTITDNSDGTWTVCFATVSGLYPAGDGGETFDVTVEIDDGGPDKASNTCDVHFEVLVTEPFTVKIEKVEGPSGLGVIQGTHVTVDVTMETGSEMIGGFDFLIAYDASALIFTTALEGDVYSCAWEYFNYRYGPYGNCGNACPSGMLRVVGIAETNNGPIHPDWACMDVLYANKPFTFFQLDFLVTDDRTFECMYVPIRFFWMDCGDNTLSSKSGDTLFVSRYVIDFDLIGHIEDPTTGFPTYTGVQDFCLVGGGPEKPAPIQFIDFYNGGIDIICADDIDDRGDINFNGVSNEIADAVLFSNYFVWGLSVFTINVDGQIAATDINADGLTLSVADLVYLIRVVVGDALPYPKVGPVSAAYTADGGLYSVDTEMGAAFVVVAGNRTPTLLADNMEMKYAFDGANTRILVYSMDKGEAFNGDFLRVDGQMVSAEFATYEGAPVSAKAVPGSYKLYQNYPNPFNPTTTVNFAVPTSGDYSLKVFNVTGQEVYEVTGTVAAAGIVPVELDATSWASGIYFYQININNFTDTKKMVLLK